MKTLTINNDTYEIVDEKARESIAEVSEKFENVGSAIHIGTEPPEDEKVNVWIDTDEEPEASGVDVTAEVGQTIVVEEVDANGKPTKWKAMDFQPRTHWVEPVELVNGTAVLNADAGVLILPTNIQFTAGQTYHVTYNGTEYTCTAVFHEMVGYAIGNLAMAGLPDTGEPFCMMTQEGALGIMDFNGVTEATVKILGESVHKLPSKFIPTPDWNANEGEPGHVLNRTHYVETVKSEWLPETVCEFTEDMEGLCPLGEKTITAGATYKVTWNGVEYICVAEYVVGIGVNVFGNISYFDDSLPGYTEPFAALVMDGQAMLMTFEALPLTATVSIEEIAEVYHPLDRRYLPASSYIITDVTDTTVNESYDNFADILWNGGNVWIERVNDTGVVRYKIITYTYNANGFTLLCSIGADKLVVFTATNGTWTPHTE